MKFVDELINLGLVIRVRSLDRVCKSGNGWFYEAMLERHLHNLSGKLFHLFKEISFIN